MPWLAYSPTSQSTDVVAYVEHQRNASGNNRIDGAPALNAGAAPKTLLAAPPTLFTVDPTSGANELDLDGLATGGGIGVLETRSDVPPGNADLIAPNGVVNAGDAGIRVSGNLNIAALHVINTFNIEVGGTTTGVPQAVAPNLGALTEAANTAGAAAKAAADQSRATQPPAALPPLHHHRRGRRLWWWLGAG